MGAVPVNPGMLRDRITVQQSSESVNALGEAVMEWQSIGDVWARVEGVSSREALLTGQQSVTITHRVRLRHFAGLTHQHRFVWRGRTLEIVSLLEHANRTEHEAICTEMP